MTTKPPKLLLVGETARSLLELLQWLTGEVAIAKPQRPIWTPALW